MSLPDADRGRLAWWLFGIALGAAILYVVYRFIGTIVFGIFLYYATRPVFKQVHARVEQRSLAASLSLTLLVLPALLLFGYTASIAYSEFSQFAKTAGQWAQEVDFGQYEPLFQTYLDASKAVTDPQQLLSGNGVEVVSGILLASVSYLGTLGLFALHLFVIVAIAFYLLRDDHRLSTWMVDRLGGGSDVLEAFLTAVDDDFNNIFFGNILNAVATGTIGAIVYTLLNLWAPQGVSIPYAALLGLLTGIASLIPVVGMKIVYVPVAAYVFALPFVNQQPEALWFPVAFALVSFVVVDTFPDLVLRPYVSGRSLHMGALMLAYILGPLLFGFYGLFLLPMLLVLVIHFGRIVMPELAREQPLQPHAVDPTSLAAGAAPVGEAAVDRGSTDVSGERPVGGRTTDETGRQGNETVDRPSEAGRQVDERADRDSSADRETDARGSNASDDETRTEDGTGDDTEDENTDDTEGDTEDETDGGANDSA